MRLLNRVEFLLLMVILAMALGLRLWGIQFGLPYAYHIDEPAYVSAALNLGAGVIGRQPNPTGFINILFGEYGVYYLTGRTVGWFASAADFERGYRSDPSMFILLGRLTSAVLGTLNVLVVYWLGRAVRDRLTGTIAALFMSVAFLHVRDSHYAVPDTTMTFLVTLTLLLIVLAVQRQNLHYQYLAAVVSGFAIATKWNVVPLLIPLALGVFYQYRKRDKSIWTSRFAMIVAVCLIFLMAGFLIGGFQLIMQPMTYMRYARLEAESGKAGGFGNWQIDTVPGWLFYLKTLSYGLGVTLLALAMVGCLHRLLQVWRTRDRIGVLLLVFPLSYYLTMGATRHYFARYALPLVPFMALFAAEVIVIGTILWSKKSRMSLGWILGGVIVLATAYPLSQSIRHDILLGRQDTRTIAKWWIENHLPAGAKIAMDWDRHGPPLSTPEKTMPYSDKVYAVRIIGKTGLSEHPVAWYLENGFDYMIASSFIYDISLVFKEKDEARRAFYESLPQELKLVQQFRPSSEEAEPSFIFDEIYGPVISLWQRDRPGPTIKVYKLDLWTPRQRAATIPNLK